MFLLATELWCDSTQLTCGIQTVLALLYFVWLYTWAQKQLGNAAVAIVFAVIIIYLTVWLHPWLIWVPALIYVFNRGGKDILGEILGGSGGGHGGGHGHH